MGCWEVSGVVPSARLCATGQCVTRLMHFLHFLPFSFISLCLNKNAETWQRKQEVWTLFWCVLLKNMWCSVCQICTEWLCCSTEVLQGRHLALAFQDVIVNDTDEALLVWQVHQELKSTDLVVAHFHGGACFFFFWRSNCLSVLLRAWILNTPLASFQSYCKPTVGLLAPQWNLSSTDHHVDNRTKRWKVQIQCPLTVLCRKIKIWST